MSVICDTLNERLQHDSQPKGARRPLPKGSVPSATLENASGINRYLNGAASAHPTTDGYELSIANETIPTTSPVGRPVKHITVLLVEERTIVRQGIGALLDAEENIEVAGQTADVSEALALAEKLRPDVVIISIRLALRAGLESFRRNIGASCGARVVVLLPHNENNALTDHVSAAGATGSITEQASARLLTAAVRTAFWSHHPFENAGTRLQSEYHSGAERDITRLTSREREVLQFIAEGNGNKQTASKLNISVKTVEKHRQSIMDKLGIHETATLTRYAMYAGLVQ
jgi:DNA-binding NarL/FixJ family response regulator